MGLETKLATIFRVGKTALLVAVLAVVARTGVMPRGEVGIVVAQIGLSLTVITDALFGVVLFMSVATP